MDFFFAIQLVETFWDVSMPVKFPICQGHSTDILLNLQKVVVEHANYNLMMKNGGYQAHFRIIK